MAKICEIPDSVDDRMTERAQLTTIELKSHGFLRCLLTRAIAEMQWSALHLDYR